VYYFFKQYLPQRLALSFINVFYPSFPLVQNRSSDRQNLIRRCLRLQIYTVLSIFYCKIDQSRPHLLFLFDFIGKTSFGISFFRLFHRSAESESLERRKQSSYCGHRSRNDARNARRGQLLPAADRQQSRLSKSESGKRSGQVYPLQFHPESVFRLSRTY